MRLWLRWQRLLGLATISMLAGGMAACSRPPAPGEERIGENEAEIEDAMIAAIETIALNEKAAGIVPRLNQNKTQGCLDAEFTVADGLEEQLRHGIFAEPATYPARIRFANASTNDDREKDFRGMSLKLFDVEGEPLWGEAGEQDFLFNSYPALFAENPKEFLAFVDASADDALWKFFINPLHWDAVTILLKGREVITSPFDITYWSTTPYRLGPDESVAVKYSARSCSAISSDMPGSPHAFYLRENMRLHLQEGEACFDFMVQFQGNPETMPIEDASVIWDEEISPFIKVATLTIENQQFNDSDSLLSCEGMRFNPWQSLPEHRPLGGINRVRQRVYEEAGDYRVQNSLYDISGDNP